MEPNFDENESSTPLQRLLIGLGTLIVVILTLGGAVFLAMQDSAAPTPTPMAQFPPTPTTAVAVAATSTLTPTPIPPTDTPLPPATFTPTASPTPLPPGDTATVTPLPPTVTLLPETPTPVTPPPPPIDTPVGPLNSCADTPATWVTYQVMVGDTLNSLAERTNVSVHNLFVANCLQSYTVYPGDVIYLPFTPATPTPTVTSMPTPTLLPTGTRTATPVAPRITDAIVKADVGANQVAVFGYGENFRPFQQGFRAELVGLTTIPLNIQSGTSTNFEGRAPLDLLSLGDYSLVVTNPDGRAAIRNNVWPPRDSTATPTPAPPEITRVSPASGQLSKDARLTVQGRNFRPKEPGFRLELQLESGGFNVEFSIDEAIRPATATSFDILIPANSLVLGVYDLLVTNPDGQTDIERFAYDAIN